eukprot:5249617-Prymnesium_polylepis.1
MAMAMYFFSPLSLLDAQRMTTAFAAGNSSDLTLRAPRATSETSKTLTRFDAPAQTCDKTEKTFCGWLSAVANVPTARDSMDCDAADRIVQSQTLSSGGLPELERLMAIGMPLC